MQKTCVCSPGLGPEPAGELTALPRMLTSFTGERDRVKGKGKEGRGKGRGRETTRRLCFKAVFNYLYKPCIEMQLSTAVCWCYMLRVGVLWCWQCNFCLFTGVNNIAPQEPLVT